MGHGDRILPHSPSWRGLAWTGSAHRRGPSKRSVMVVRPSGAWALDIPGDLLLAWRVADTGPWVVWIYVGHAIVCAWAVHWLYRSAREE